MSPPTFSCGTWTWLLRVVLTVVALKWSQRGRPFSHGAQLAIDTTLVFLLRADGVPHIQCANFDGAACKPLATRNERTYPELSGTQGRARLVVFGAEVGGRWSEETRCFISLLARVKVRPFAQDHPCSRPAVLALPLGVHSLLRCRESSGIFAPRKPRESRHGWPDVINVRRHVRLTSYARRGGVICMRLFLVRLCLSF